MQLKWACIAHSLDGDGHSLTQSLICNHQASYWCSVPYIGNLWPHSAVLARESKCGKGCAIEPRLRNTLGLKSREGDCTLGT
eukprot:5980182-Pyramimonas_sp.AAC.1